ncbi:hypothetical protein DTO027B5_4483 [Paecilomyces variotii]|nr:hypothetical protein DTO212C5_6791 [Paecilomyces variotii]KAJ9323542.1 hypothetical protein DTO027B3_5414 [Paecilomyces variotii]KAJ9333703.1 hypothetical protein DTO027B5_4483 [Paecilomyces variotii]
MSRNISHGRGGAGNMFAKDAPPTPEDLTTPTIKQDYYTTGRGGTGNMMHNDKEHPEIARESQDVEAPPLRLEEGRHFTGRGGVANAVIPTPEEEKHLQEQEQELRRVLTARADSKERAVSKERAREKEKEKEKEKEGEKDKDQDKEHQHHHHHHHLYHPLHLH